VKKRLKAFVTLAFVVPITAAASSGGTSTAGAGAQKGKSPSRVERGRAVYEAKCVRCHGADGAGRTRMADIVEPPDMTDAEWQRRRSDARMIGAVANGLGQMPAFKKKLTRQEIAAAVAYVRTLKSSSQ
jgi:mono/diheme cytochrome c family protein